ncbi:GDP-D-glucose phosphorylase 1 [Sarcoptes scabiei]|uniref:GDP-D-glucose phosphorylase 1 n=1 Tax=Sarcoptes scabiei TaxID=52283 RepID=A0A834R6Y8_SARSC|nr:GDP-D-glucose phosphorylase 1 [Sarcoptes scabiei]
METQKEIINVEVNAKTTDRTVATTKSDPDYDDNNDDDDDGDGTNRIDVKNLDDSILEYTEIDYNSIVCNVQSRLDSLLRSKWLHRSQILNYPFEVKQIPKKIVSSDRYKFIVILIPGRSPKLRRPPDAMLSLRQRFDSNSFNFTKIDPFERLFEIKSNFNGDRFHSTIVINKNPIQFCSSLMVPFLDKCLPQILTEQSLHMAVSVLALSDFQSLRLGFNSPGAMASVNHQHWHVFYLEEHLLIEDLDVIDYVLQGWPIPALVFEIQELNDDYISVILKDVMRIVEYCLNDGNISYNIFMTRNQSNMIKIFLWTLEPRWGRKDDAIFNVAFCELSGYFICHSESSFNEMNEQHCLEAFRSVRSKHNEVIHLLQ